MKTRMTLMVVVLGLISQGAFSAPKTNGAKLDRKIAREAKAALFKKTAETAVKDGFGRDGDKVSSKLTQMNHDSTLMEEWEVSLTNGASKGSALFSVTITTSEAKEGSDDGSYEAMKVVVRYLDGT